LFDRGADALERAAAVGDAAAHRGRRVAAHRRVDEHRERSAVGQDAAPGPTLADRVVRGDRARRDAQYAAIGDAATRRGGVALDGRLEERERRALVHQHATADVEHLTVGGGAAGDLYVGHERLAVDDGEHAVAAVRGDPRRARADAEDAACSAELQLAERHLVLALVQHDRGPVLGVPERLAQRAVVGLACAGAVVAVRVGVDEGRQPPFDGADVARHRLRPREEALVGGRAVLLRRRVDRLAPEAECVRVGRAAVVVERQQGGERVLEVADLAEVAARVIREVVALLDEPDRARARLLEVRGEQRVPHRHLTLGRPRLIETAALRRVVLRDRDVLHREAARRVDATALRGLAVAVREGGVAADGRVHEHGLTAGLDVDAAAAAAGIRAVAGHVVADRRVDDVQGARGRDAATGGGGEVVGDHRTAELELGARGDTEAAAEGVVLVAARDAIGDGEPADRDLGVGAT
jgi:hypothetical protein